MNTPAFLQHLQGIVRQLQTVVEKEFAALDQAALNFKATPQSWSVLECLEHLNRYGRYYNPALTKVLQQPGRTSGEVGYSWLGRKSLDIVRPDNGKLHKTVKHMNPNNSQLSRAVLDEFLQHQAQLLALLGAAHTADLNRKAVPVEFFRLLKLRTGEALEFVVLHEQRHVQQAQRALKMQQSQQAKPLLAV
jgi:hypothetical protein